MFSRAGAALFSAAVGPETDKALPNNPRWCTVSDTKAEQTLVQPALAWGGLESWVYSGLKGTTT